MTLKDNLMYEIDWRISELVLIKTNHLSSNLSVNRCNVIKKFSVVAIYAIFEGFIVQAFKTYVDAINKLELDWKLLHINILNYHLNKTYNIHRETRTKSEKQLNLIANLQCFFNSPKIELSKKIETESNINLKVLNKLFTNFNIENINDKKIENGLNKLLQYRNSIAHGENTLKVENDLIVELIDVVTYTMDLVADSLIDGFDNKSYLK